MEILNIPLGDSQIVQGDTIPEILFEFDNTLTIDLTDFGVSIKMQIYNQNNKIIDIYDTITHSNGTELNTPARIAKNNGVIEISKKAFDTYTVPMRMAILLHEFSHYYVNENMDDESEADLNGLLIYLSLGYPRIEAHEAWLDVFMDSASEANAERYKIIEKFIKDFENNKI